MTLRQFLLSVFLLKSWLFTETLTLFKRYRIPGYFYNPELDSDFLGSFPVFLVRLQIYIYAPATQHWHINADCSTRCSRIDRMEFSCLTKVNCIIWKALWYGACPPGPTQRDVCLLQVLCPFCQYHTRYLAVIKMPAESEKFDLMSSLFSRSTSSAWTLGNNSVNRICSWWRKYFREQFSVT